ncbi:hypothetical protein ABCR94_05265 [Streptomyces sp. 21So2-11]|uniref:hypothetical protein n=1 Tax=Streptomyces sp. 21So2-11 TaxID=3144408 RepID=UPI00321A852D
MNITPPLERIKSTPDIDPSSDYDSLVMDLCELLSTSDCQFAVGGFGQDCWPVDVSYDLSTVIEQLPDVIDSLRGGGDAEIDFYGQGVERRVSFLPLGDLIAIHCSSGTAWTPTPDSETATMEEVTLLLSGLAHDFKVALELAHPNLSGITPFAAW